MRNISLPQNAYFVMLSSLWMWASCSGGVLVTHWMLLCKLQLQAYSCDADWAGDPNDRKSTTGFVILINDAPISWCSKKQSAVSRSSTEAEYRSMADTTSEIMWLSLLLQDLHIQLVDIPTLHCDNVSALALATNLVYRFKIKAYWSGCTFHSGTSKERIT